MQISRTYALVAAVVASLVVGIVTTDCGTSTTCLRYSDCSDGLTCADGLCVVPPKECGEAGPCEDDAGTDSATTTSEEDGAVELTDSATTTDASTVEDAGDAGNPGDATTVMSMTDAGVDASDAASATDSGQDAGIHDASAD